MKRGVRPRPDASSCAISTSKPTTRVGSAASASTYGAPPSASPPHRSSGRLCERNGADRSVRHTSGTNAKTRVDITGQGLGYRDSVVVEHRRLTSHCAFPRQESLSAFVLHAALSPFQLLERPRPIVAQQPR